MRRKRNAVVQALSDFSTAGVTGGILNLITPLPSGLQALVTLGIPMLACMYNVGDRTITNRLASKDKEKVERILYDLQIEMEKRGLEDLRRFVQFDFSTEEYAIVEELVKQSINAKNEWIRKLAASILVTVGSQEVKNLKGMERCLRFMTELDDLDTQLLMLHIYINHVHLVDRNKIIAEAQEIKQKIIEDDTVYAQSIKVSAEKLAFLGLVMRSTSMYPYEDEENSKKRIIDDFLSKNTGEITAHCISFLSFLQGTLNE
ncbi:MULTISPECIES: hypothetical protein [Paenibacillus]|uniref:hypothetical protein n=1 Tax=Paenibacillus TaxID=44249 RepID=UPI0013536DF5|nr:MULTISPECIES: hypothetical protein [Paenibacillus]MXO78412.1 hypothetical protein [Paenibacillus sp. OT2-17]